MGYLIDTFRGGISAENNKGTKGSFKYGHGLDIRARNDSLTNRQAMLPITPSGMNDLVRWFVPATDGSIYCFGSAGSTWAMSGATGDPAFTFVYNDSNGAIKGAAEWKLSTGVDYLFWATNTSLATKPLVGNGVIPWTDATQDFKTTLDPATYHTMGLAAGELMIANNSYLATEDYNGNFNVAALNVIPGNNIKALEERDDNIILGSYRTNNSEEGHLWSWVTNAMNWVQKKRIPAQGVNALITTELLLAQAGTNGEIFFSDFINALPIIGIPGGGQVNPSSVAIENDVALFGFYGGTYPGIWSYGRKRKDLPYSLNYDYRLSPTVAGSTVAEIGAVTMVNGILYASWQVTDGSTITYGVDQVSSTTKATAVYEGLEFNAGTPTVQRWYKNTVLSMVPLPSGTSVSVKFKVNQQSAWSYAILSDGSTTFSVTNAVFAEFQNDTPGFVYEMGLELNPSANTAPEITGMNTDLEGAYGHR